VRRIAWVKSEQRRGSAFGGEGYGLSLSRVSSKLNALFRNCDRDEVFVPQTFGTESI
jgi:hypothetical protein